MTVATRAFASSSKHTNILDQASSMLLFLASTFNLLFQLAISVTLQSPKFDLIRRLLHEQAANFLCSTCFIVCWNYIWLFFDTCLASSLDVGSSYAKFSKTGNFTASAAGITKFKMRDTMCAGVLYPTLPTYFAWPTIYAGVASCLNLAIFFASLALALVCRTHLSQNNAFVNKPCLLVAAVVFGLSHPMIMGQSLYFELCEDARNTLQVQVKSFIALSIVGGLVGVLDDFLGIFHEKDWSWNVVDGKLGMKVVWVVMCIASLGLVACIQSSYRGMVGFAAGLIFIVILLVWGVVDLWILASKKISENSVVLAAVPVEGVKSNAHAYLLKKKKDTPFENSYENSYAYQLIPEYEPTQHVSSTSNNLSLRTKTTCNLFSSDDVRSSLRLRGANTTSLDTDHDMDNMHHLSQTEGTERALPTEVASDAFGNDDAGTALNNIMSTSKLLWD